MRSSKLLLAFAIVTAVWFIEPVQAVRTAPELLSDPGFENVKGIPPGFYSVFTGSIGDGWSVSKGAIVIINGSQFGVAPHSGNQYADLDLGSSPNTLSQTVATVIGQSYLISCWLFDVTPNPLAISFGSQVLFEGFSPSTGQYLNLTFLGVATSTTTTLSFTGRYTGPGGTVGTVLDDVSVKPAGVPDGGSTVSLLGCALLGLAALRRKLGC